MKIQFLGAAHEVTGSCTLLQAAGKNILVDFGMEQGLDIYANCDLPIMPSDIDCVILTHAHIDHSGKLPYLAANGFKGPIYATGATVKLCNIMLYDSAHIQEFEAEWRNRKAKRAGDKPYTPLYTTDDVTETLKCFVPCNYNDTIELFDGISLKFIDAGHLLGSASAEVTVCEDRKNAKKVLFSGDLGNVNRPLIRDPEKPDEADYVIVESTYGNRLHGPRKDYKGQLVNVLKTTFDRGGNVVIPSFAVGRTQELLYLISEIKNENLLPEYPNFPVYVDSPLAVEATKIYDGGLMDYYDEEALDKIHKGINILSFEGLHTAVSSEESIQINYDPSPKVIISASGMCEAGRIRHHLKHNLWRKECTVLFVGYQSEQTLGNKLLSGAEDIKLFGEPIKVAAHLEQMDGISGHADMNIILDWLGALKNKPEMVFVNHGQDEVTDSFAETVKERLGFEAVAPYNGAVFDLDTNTCLETGQTVKLEKAQGILAKRKGASIFEKLMAAAKRLLGVVEKNRGGTNKDLEKFTHEIDDLCDRWDR